MGRHGWERDCWIMDGCRCWLSGCMDEVVVDVMIVRLWCGY